MYREGDNVYPVNDIAINRVYGTFATCGSDGAFAFWDKIAKQKLKSFPKMGCPISAIDFNYNTTMFAYAVGYDWYKGIGGE